MSGSNSGDFVGGLQDAIRQNPVSAALVGVGLLWMFTGGSKLTAAAALLGPAARSATSGAASGAQYSADMVSQAAESVRSLGARVSDSVQDTLSDAATTVGDAASRTYGSLKGTAGSTQPATTKTPSVESSEVFGGALRDNLTQTLQRQPLLLGALGLAIGAGIAAAFPTTQTEQDFAGRTADGVVAQIKDAASSATDKVTAAASRTLQAVKQEAVAQGLTLQAVKEGAAAVGDKVKLVAKAAHTQSSMR